MLMGNVKVVSSVQKHTWCPYPGYGCNILVPVPETSVGSVGVLFAFVDVNPSRACSLGSINEMCS